MTTLFSHIKIETAPNPTAAVIWLHGLGADGSDFASIVPQLNLKACAPIRFIFPHAPSIPVSINNGYVMPAWYDIKTVDLVRQEDSAGIALSAKAINALIADQMKQGIASAKIVLAGFSQGCAMVLYTGLRQPAPLGGIMALSGYLPLAETLAQERHINNANVPIFMAHGTQDPVVPIQRAQASKQILENLKYPVQWHEYPMPHSVHPKEIADISYFLTQVLPANKP